LEWKLKTQARRIQQSAFRLEISAGWLNNLTKGIIDLTHQLKLADAPLEIIIVLLKILGTLLEHLTLWLEFQMTCLKF
jgi:hypothetical protein